MIPIDDFLANLDGVVTDGHGGWMARCPAHGDVNPSLHVNLGDDGRILLKCFSGCTAEEVCHAIGLELKDIMPDNGRKPKRGRKAKARPAPSPRPSSEAAKKPRDYGRHVCYYEYKDESGAIAYRVDRRVHADGSKDFYQQHPDETSKFGWSWGVSSVGVQVLPFRLPELLAAAKAGKTVVIAEGEKDVLSIVKRLNLAATCNSGGAGKWQASFARYFEGVPRVLIVSDKDPEFKEVNGKIKPHWRGQRHACDVEQKLLSAGYQGKIVKIVMPDVVIGGCGEAIPCKDFTDWCEAMDLAGQTVDRSAFQRVVADFGEWPQEWNFEAADLADLPRSQKSERKSSSSSSAAPAPAKAGEATGGEVEGKSDNLGECGRFGRLRPRAPGIETRIYEVDFQINAKKYIRVGVGVDYVDFVGYSRTSERSKFTRGERVVGSGPLSTYAGFVVGNLYTFCEHNYNEYKRILGVLAIKLAVCWLRARGTFFADEDNPCYSSSMYFNEGDGTLYIIRSDEFMSFLATEVDLTRDVRTYGSIMTVLDDLAMNRNETQRVTPSRQWEKKNGNIYLSCGNSKMYRITKTSVDKVDNGTDGVVFVRGYTLDEWEFKPGDGIDPFSWSLAFRTAAWKDPASLMNIRLWYLNVFFCHKNKPILLIEGPAGSGKTTIARLLKLILGMRDNGRPDSTVNTVSNTDKGMEDYWVIVHTGRLEVFDNLDQRVKWANNELQIASTGGSHKGRRLYKDDQTYIMYANACQILTSNNPIFATEGGGLPDRIIQAHLGLGRKESFDSELTADITRRRDEYLTWTARILSAALADEKPVDQTINKRHPDYGTFSVRCARAIGCEAEAIRAMSAAEIDKAVLPLMNETVAKEIYAALLRQSPVGVMKFTAGEMSECIINSLDGDGVDEKTKTIYGSRRIGKALSTFRKEFSSLFRMKEPRISAGKTLYEFDGMTAQGASILEANGGLVGLDGQIRKSPSDIEGAGTLSENHAMKSTNPPYARAGADSVNSSISDNNNIEGVSNDGIGDDDDLTF